MEPGEPGFLAAVGSFISVLVACLVAAVVKLRSQGAEMAKVRHDLQRQSREDEKDEFRELVQLQGARIRTLERRVDAAEAREQQCKEELTEQKTVNARIETRMEGHEDAMRAAGIRFRPWNPGDPGSQVHDSLPPSGGTPETPPGKGE